MCFSNNEDMYFALQAIGLFLDLFRLFKHTVLTVPLLDLLQSFQSTKERQMRTYNKIV